MKGLLVNFVLNLILTKKKNTKNSIVVILKIKLNKIYGKLSCFYSVILLFLVAQYFSQ